MPSLQEIRQLIEARGVRRIDLKVTDLFGTWHHFAIPPERLSEELIQNGFGFDGSSLRGFQPIDESDMLLVPDMETAVMDPFTAQPQLIIFCDVKDPITGELYERDPRGTAKKAEQLVKDSGLGTDVFFG